MLSDIHIKPGYVSPPDNIVQDFLLPCMSEATRYCRVAGYFSSSALKHYTKGLESLIANQGKYQLIISNEISEFDYNQIVQGYTNRLNYQDKITEVLKVESDSSLQDKKNLANLAYLIEIGLIDIKIGFIHSGLFHAKYGIFTDIEGNQVYFNGSNNETENALLNNFETFDTKKSWLYKENQEYIHDLQNQFDNLWSEENNNGILYVSEVNEYMRYKMQEYSRGKIIMDEEVFEQNSLVLIYNESQLKLINNYHNTLPRSRYLRKIERYTIDKEKYIFKANLNYKDIEKIINLFKKFEEREKIKVKIAKSVYDFISNAEFEINDIANRGLLLKSEDEKILNSINEFNNIVNQEFQEGFSLRGIQKRVSFYMMTMKRAANFSVPGSGKTAMVYGVYAYLSSSKINQIEKLIVIGPKNSFLAWKEEFSKIFGTKRRLRVLDIHSAEYNEMMFLKNVNEYNLILVNYESLQKYASHLKKVINERTMVVFDEVHKVKKINSIRANIAIDLANRADYRYVLTGTPIPNSYTDIWNFLHILYDYEYDDYFGVSETTLSNPSPVDIKEINNKLLPFFWRVTKDELGVPKANKDYLYDFVANDFEQEVINLLWRKYSYMPLKLYIRLIQFSSNPQLLLKNIHKEQFIDIETNDDEDDDNLTFDFFDDMVDSPVDTYTTKEIELISQLKTTSKFEQCINKINKLCNNKKTVLVWCIFVDTIKKVEQRVRALGHRPAVIHGKVSAIDREKIIKGFQLGFYDVLITNPHTLAESVSLHKACHDAIYLEYSFNLTHMLQSRDRIHRLGLSPEEETNYYYFFLEGQQNERSTIDQIIYDRLKEKEEVMLNSIEGTNINVNFDYDEKAEIVAMMREELKRYN